MLSSELCDLYLEVCMKCLHLCYEDREGLGPDVSLEAYYTMFVSYLLTSPNQNRETSGRL
jgi:hypothetical protein